MIVEEHKSLLKFNTFKIDCVARFFVSVSSIQELKEVLKANIHPNLLIIGGGSNLLLTKDVDALVIHINLKGITVISEDENSIILQVKGGENWHEFVQHCVQNNFGGVENLSLIPGNVGTAPIQNIGAYGVELKDVFESCNAINIETLKTKTFTKQECNFGYRNSIFKNEEKENYIITDVNFILTKKNHHLKIEYGAIKEELAQLNITNPTLLEISNTIISIRQSKLPDPNILGNSGSFFKNPIINTLEFKNFSNLFPEAPYYKISKTEYKIPAGWLIERAGFKGKRFGDAGVHKNQALVLVNYGTATGTEIINLAHKIQTDVKNIFDISIEPEVNII